MSAQQQGRAGQPWAVARVQALAQPHSPEAAAAKGKAAALSRNPVPLLG